MCNAYVFYFTSLRPPPFRLIIILSNSPLFVLDYYRLFPDCPCWLGFHVSMSVSRILLLLISMRTICCYIPSTTPSIPPSALLRHYGTIPHPVRPFVSRQFIAPVNTTSTVVSSRLSHRHDSPTRIASQLRLHSIPFHPRRRRRRRRKSFLWLTLVHPSRSPPAASFPAASFSLSLSPRLAAASPVFPD